MPDQTASRAGSPLDLTGQVLKADVSCIALGSQSDVYKGKWTHGRNNEVVSNAIPLSKCEVRSLIYILKLFQLALKVLRSEIFDVRLSAQVSEVSSTLAACFQTVNFLPLRIVGNSLSRP